MARREIRSSSRRGPHRRLEVGARAVVACAVRTTFRCDKDRRGCLAVFMDASSRFAAASASPSKAATFTVRPPATPGDAAVNELTTPLQRTRRQLMVGPFRVSSDALAIFSAPNDTPTHDGVRRAFTVRMSHQHQTQTFYSRVSNQIQVSTTPDEKCIDKRRVADAPFVHDNPLARQGIWSDQCCTRQEGGLRVAQEESGQGSRDDLV